MKSFSKRFFGVRMVRAAIMALVAAAMLVVPMHSYAGVFVSVGFAPPVLPIYAQPICPGDGYIWTPGYWAYGDDGYYWVPGTWVLAPQVGYLWTPGYWGWGGGAYLWHGGYWGPHIGFYGGVNYGFGYFGTGFYGGRWDGGHFMYNSAYSHVGVGFHNTYINRTVVENHSRVAFNGGSGGINAHANAAEEAAGRDHHVEATGAQNAHMQAASHDRANFASVNHGVPAHAATSRPASSANDFAHSNAARGANSRPNNASRPAGGNTAARGNTAPRGNTGGAPRGNTGGQPHNAPAPHNNPAPHNAPAPHGAAHGGGNHR
jgi:hypothetical protein